MFERRVTPRSLVLDLLRVAPEGGSIRDIVDIAPLFGLTANAVRVAVTRLSKARWVESDERGWYRLSTEAASVGQHVDEWRLGDDRLRPWEEDWLTAWLGRGESRGRRAQSRSALTRFGFREARSGMWVRPNNLVLCLSSLRARLHQLGLEEDAEVFVGRDFSEPLVSRWCRELWPISDTERDHQSALAALRRSSARLERLAEHRAVTESFRYGGAAIHSLSRDPLLPEEIAPGVTRRALTRDMKRYDELGRRVWSRFAADFALSGSPSPSQEVA